MFGIVLISASLQLRNPGTRAQLASKLMSGLDIKFIALNYLYHILAVESYII